MTPSNFMMALLFVSLSPRLVHCGGGDCSDLIFPPNPDIPEDVGSFFINITSVAAEDKQAYIYFYYYNNSYDNDATPGVDYIFQNNITSLNFTIPAGATQSFEINVIDDNIVDYIDDYYYWRYETIEGYIAVYSSDQQMNYCWHIHIDIIDNDGLIFEQRLSVVDEDVGTVELCVIYTNADNVPPTINATIPDMYDGDLLFNQTNFLISIGDRICFDVIIYDDDEIEYQEYFDFHVYYDDQNRLDILHDYTQISIIDDEAFRFGLERSSYSVLESDEVVTVCVTADHGDGSEVYTLSLTSINVTTQGELDHGTLDQQLTVSANTYIQCVNVTVSNDTVPEENEFFQILISSISRIASSTSIHQRYNVSAIVTIIDDDLTCSPECVNGVCIYPGVCLCDEGWIDEDCSREICPAPCINGMCNVNTGHCDCQPGYTGVTCDSDIPECDDDNGGCQQQCNDFLGGYNCSCDPGFHPLTPDASTCEDIDECMEGGHGCDQTCVNTPGSYYCNCERGYQIVNTTECEDVDECLVISPNGFCGQLCINTLGSYHCDCREGYRVFGRLFCQDIDECEEKIDNCSRAEPQAKCNNLEGGYECTCDHHTGYRLSSDGITCEDINECEEGDHLCTELCINTPGSYDCSCPNGYALDEDDGITCHEIDECDMMNGGCQHSCTNTASSFFCTCDLGYVLLEDGFTCEALNCPLLEAPLNGTIVCDTQSVGGTCTFSCNEGYTLRGSTSRSCPPSLQWSGQPTVCDPPMCPDLRPPKNGFVLFPCTREEGDTCNVVCAHGYSTKGSTNQTCENDTTTDSLLWSMGPQCERSDPCIPNPCKNGGVCVKEGDDFTCACDGTGYGGLTCRAAIIYFEPIPPVTMGTSFQVRFFTNASLQSPQRVDVTLNRRLGVRKTYLRPHLLYVEESFNGMTGVVTVTLPRNDINFRYEPRRRTVFISDGSRSETMSYFDQLGLLRGQLRPGCCTPNTALITCPESTQTIPLRSTCKWTLRTSDDLHRSPGIVFAGSLPTSISGLRYRTANYTYDIIFQERECKACDECDNVQYTFTLNDVPELLNARALAFTYIGKIQELLPSWLSLFVNLDWAMETSPLSKFDSFAPVTRHQEQVSSIDGCSKLSGLRGSVYSVLIKV